MKIHRAPESSHVAADVLYRRFMRAHFRGIVFNLIAAAAISEGNFCRSRDNTRTRRVLPSRDSPPTRLHPYISHFSYRVIPRVIITKPTIPLRFLKRRDKCVAKLYQCRFARDN